MKKTKTKQDIKQELLKRLKSVIRDLKWRSSYEYGFASGYEKAVNELKAYLYEVDIDVEGDDE